MFFEAIIRGENNEEVLLNKSECLIYVVAEEIICFVFKIDKSPIKKCFI